MDLLYQFQETGVGCADHQDPACLCDVTPLPGGVPVKVVPDARHYPSFEGNEALRFIVWASTAIGRFEALSGINETVLNEALSIWEGRRSDHDAKSARVTAAHRCLRGGLTLEQTARWLSATLFEVMDLFYDRPKHALVLEMEKYVRSGKHSAEEIARLTGCEQKYATALARSWGIRLPHSSVRYGPEVKEKARSMVKSGMSRRAVARALAISETRVSTWCEDLPTLYNGKKSK